MQQIYKSILLMLLVCAPLRAQQYSVQITVQTLPENRVLPGATIYFSALNKGGITAMDGIAIFDLPEGNHAMEISYLGFETLKTNIQVTAQNTSFQFSIQPKENSLEEVVLQATRSTRTIRKTPTRIEFIGEEELGEKVAMNASNIGMVLRESTGIQMQQTSLSSANTNIRIQGLDGRYTQLLRDGFPLYGGFSSGLSIMQIPPLDLKQFEIIKGSSSTLYGGGAIAGLVNMVSKTPEIEPDLDIMFTQTHAAGSTGNVFYSKRNEKIGVTLYGSAHYQKSYDPEDDGFSNLPKTKSVSFNPKLFLYPSEKTTIWLGLNGTYDDRVGGDMNAIENGASDNHRYTEKNTSKRVSSQAVFETQIDDNTLIDFKNSIAYFDRELQVTDFIFSGKQFNTFTEATFQKETERADWIAGANLYTVNFDEDDTASLERDQQDLTVGLFVKNIYDLSQKWILETGFRTDYAADWGFFPLPKISLLFKSEGGFSSRIGGGLGYKLPDIFAEEAEFINFKNVRGVDKDFLEAERSYGVNLDLNFSTHLTDEISFSVNQLFYLTAINNALLLNSKSDGFFEFENAPEEILSKGAETNIKFSYRDFRWFLNYALIDTHLNYLPGKPEKPLTAKHNAGSVIMYENPLWRLGFETYYTGKQVLSNGIETTDFITLGFLGMRNFNWGSLFVNFENFTDRRQSRFSPLVLPPHENPSFPEIYAPTDGFIFSAGVILKPFGNAED